MAQSGSRSALINVAQIDRKVYSLRKVQIVSNTRSLDNAAVCPAKQRATCSNDTIDRASTGNLVGRFQCKVPYLAMMRGRF